MHGAGGVKVAIFYEFDTILIFRLSIQKWLQAHRIKVSPIPFFAGTGSGF